MVSVTTEKRSLLPRNSCKWGSKSRGYDSFIKQFGMRSRGHFEKCRERERKLTAYRGFAIHAVVFPTLSIQAVFQCVFLDPLVSVHAALTSNTTDFCRTLKLNLEPLVFVVSPGWPSTCSWACSLEVKATVVRPVSMVILWRSLNVPWFDLSILHTKSVQT